MIENDDRDRAPEGFAVALVFFFGFGFFCGALVTLLVLEIFK